MEQKILSILDNNVLIAQNHKGELAWKDKAQKREDVVTLRNNWNGQ